MVHDDSRKTQPKPGKHNRRSAEISAERDSAKLVFLASLSCWPGALVALRGMTSSSGKRLKTIASKRKDKEPEQRHSSRKLATYPAPANIAVVKEFYTNARKIGNYLAEEYLSYVRGHTIRYDSTSINNFLGTEWVGEQCQFTLCLEEGFKVNLMKEVKKDRDGIRKELKKCKRREAVVSPLGERYLVLPSLLLHTIRSHLPRVKQVFTFTPQRSQRLFLSAAQCATSAPGQQDKEAKKTSLAESRSAEISAERDSAKLVFLASLSCWPGALVALRGMTSSSGKRLKTIASKRKDKEPEQRHSSRKLATYPAPANIAVVKEFYTNARKIGNYLAEEYLSYVRGHTIRYDSTSINNFLGTEWVGEQCQFTLCLEEGFKVNLMKEVKKDRDGIRKELKKCKRREAMCANTMNNKAPLGHPSLITHLCKITAVDISAPPFERPRKSIDESYYRQYYGGEEATQLVPDDKFMNTENGATNLFNNRQV
ncbi:hypothetical protein LR48_Vigan312s000700 [Vigna angularis]|uniref:Putative plant transposon protein domain-containing protein n=1 Tax=Phaseolus angularis TaxID=3914 RepID=A0A0L9T8N9_PHAAN|nr:hypothetical protein LR48_Vigan312s000700 [Vigna angularis]